MCKRLASDGPRGLIEFKTWGQFWLNAVGGDDTAGFVNARFKTRGVVVQHEEHGLRVRKHGEWLKNFKRHQNAGHTSAVGGREIVDHGF